MRISAKDLGWLAVDDGNRWIITDKGKEIFKQESGLSI